VKISSNKSLIIRAIFLLSLFILSARTPADCQVLSDTSTMNLIKRSVDHIYSLDFENAGRLNAEVVKRYPGHPVNYLLEAMTIYWENFPLLPGSEAKSSYEDLLKKCVSISETESDSGYATAEYQLANLSGRGLLLLFYSDNDMSKEVIPLATSTYRPLRKAFEYTAECPDLLYFTGLYNYYRDAYPRIYPIYKAVAFIFPPGDGVAGLHQMERASAEGFVLNAESLFMLFWINAHFEQNYSKSIEYISRLSNKYPQNPLHRLMLIKNLILLGRYEDASKVIVNKGPERNRFYNATVQVYKGLIEEKKNLSNQKASEFYLKAIEDLNEFIPYSNDQIALAYYGLERISKANGNKEQMRYYHRKANELADFKKIRFDD